MNNPYVFSVYAMVVNPCLRRGAYSGNEHVNNYKNSQRRFSQGQVFNRFDLIIPIFILAMEMNQLS